MHPSQMREPSFAFIVTKPLQLMVVMALNAQLPLGKKTLLLVDNFFDAEHAFEKLKKTNRAWSSILFFQNVSAAFEYCRKAKHDQLFIDSDVGFRKYLLLFKIKAASWRTVFSVYEEGLGSYRADLYSGVRRLALKISGGAFYFGGCWLTKKIYLYRPDEYKNSIRSNRGKEEKILITIPELLAASARELVFIFGGTEIQDRLRLSENRECCVIYLSAWTADLEIIAKEHLSGSCFNVLKLHPHFRSDFQHGADNFDLCVVPSMPAEILIAMAANLFDRVEVLHHGSSVERYLTAGNVQYKNITQTSIKRSE